MPISASSSAETVIAVESMLAPHLPDAAEVDVVGFDRQPIERTQAGNDLEAVVVERCHCRLRYSTLKSVCVTPAPR